MLDPAPLYGPLRERCGELNVEGAFVSDGRLVLRPRADGSAPDNHVARFLLDAIAAWADGSPDPASRDTVVPLRLGDIEGVPLRLTDGALVGVAVVAVDRRGRITVIGRLGTKAKVEGLLATGACGRTVLTVW